MASMFHANTIWLFLIPLKDIPMSSKRYVLGGVRIRKYSKRAHYALG